MNNERAVRQDKKEFRSVVAWNGASFLLILLITHLIVLSDIRFWALREMIGPMLIPVLAFGVGICVSLPIFGLRFVKQYWLLMPMIAASAAATLVLYQGIDAGPFKLRVIYEQQQLVEHGQLHFVAEEFPDDRTLQALVQQAPAGWRVRETRRLSGSKDQYWVHLLQPSRFFGAVDYVGLYEAKSNTYTDLVKANELWNEWVDKQQGVIPVARQYVAARFENDEFLYQCKGGVCHAKLAIEGQHILARTIDYVENETFTSKQL